MDARTAVPREELRVARSRIEAAEAEAERQLAYLQQRAGKRHLQADLARGWSAWRDELLERRRKQRLLRGAAARLARPALAACVAVWRAQWIVTERARGAARVSAAQREKARRHPSPHTPPPSHPPFISFLPHRSATRRSTKAGGLSSRRSSPRSRWMPVKVRLSSRRRWR